MPIPKGYNAQVCKSALIKLSYALPQISASMLWTPIYVMQGIYVKYYGFSMVALAGILLSSRLFDAFIDPVIGSLSDIWKAKTGRRKPFVAIGGILLMLAAIFLYVPPTEPSISYVTIWLFLFFVGLTAFLIPHMAWGDELAMTSHEKTQIFSYKNAAGYLGLVIFYALPLSPFFETSEITPETMKVAVFIACIIFLPALFFCLRFVPEGPENSHLQGIDNSTPALWSVRNLRRILKNSPFLILLGAFIATSTGMGIWYGMIFIYVDLYLGLGVFFSPLYLLAFGCGVIMSFLWASLARKIGKKHTYSVSILLGLVSVLSTSFLTPGETGAVTLAALLIGSTLTMVSNELLPISMAGDVIDYSSLKYRHNQGATYYALFMFAVKSSFAVGGAIGLGLASWLGFDPAVAHQSETGVFALEVVMSWLPAVFLFVSFIVIQFFPIDEKRHAVIRKRLDQLAKRASSTCATPPLGKGVV